MVHRGHERTLQGTGHAVGALACVECTGAHRGVIVGPTASEVLTTPPPVITVGI